MVTKWTGVILTIAGLIMGIFLGTMTDMPWSRPIDSVGLRRFSR